MKINIYLLILSAILTLACSSSQRIRPAKIILPKNPDIKVLGELNTNLSSDYFGSFNFILQNTSDKWLTLENFDVSFKNDSAQKYINVVKGEQLVNWSKVISQQGRLDHNGFNGIEESILSFGGNVTGISGILGTATDVLGFNKKASAITATAYPENHIYAEEIIIPPGLLVEKWILFNSRKHSAINYLNNIFINFNTNGDRYEANLQFRKQRKKTKFSWRGDDPNNWRLQVEPYLIMNSSDVDQTLGFTKIRAKGDFNFPLENPELGLHVEFFNQNFAFLFDILSINVTDNVPIPEEILPNASGRFDFDIFSSELFFSYKIPSERWQFELMTGARYRKIRFDPEISSQINAFEGDWFDPAVGARLRVKITPDVFFMTRTDIGGIITGSDFTINNILGIGYRLTNRTDLTLKLNQMRTQYDTNKNSEDAFIYDGTETRLLVGAAISL